MHTVCMVSNMLCVIAPVHWTDVWKANCCCEMMQIASLNSCGSCVHFSFPIAGNTGGYRPFCTVVIIHTVYMGLHMLCVLAPVHRTDVWVEEELGRLGHWESATELTSHRYLISYTFTDNLLVVFFYSQCRLFVRGTVHVGFYSMTLVIRQHAPCYI